MAKLFEDKNINDLLSEVVTTKLSFLFTRSNSNDSLISSLIDAYLHRAFNFFILFTVMTFRMAPFKRFLAWYFLMFSVVPPR